MRTPVLLILSAVIAIPVLVAAPASASAADPQVAECFDITMEQASADVWPGSPAVPCTGPHALEIVRARPLPADVDVVDFARASCTYEVVPTTTGLNSSVKGVVANPIRVGSFSFVVSEEGSPPSFVCGVGALRYNGALEPSFVPLTGPAASLTAAERASLRFCAAVVKGRSPMDNQLTVPCSRTSRWQATAWVDLSQFFTKYPGDEAAMARMKQLCPRANFRTATSASGWDQGYTRGWCWKKYA